MKTKNAAGGKSQKNKIKQQLFEIVLQVLLQPIRVLPFQRRGLHPHRLGMASKTENQHDPQRKRKENITVPGPYLLFAPLPCQQGFLRSFSANSKTYKLTHTLLPSLNCHELWRGFNADSLVVT